MALNPQELEKINETNENLKKTYLEGVVEDETVALALRVEQARLVLYGSLAIAGGALTAAWAGQRVPCTSALRSGIVLLLLAVGCAWQALIWTGVFRFRRIARKYANLKAAQFSIFHATGLFQKPEQSEADKTYKAETRASSISTHLTAIAYGLAAVGSGILVDAALDAVAKKGCWTYFLWPFTYLN